MHDDIRLLQTMEYLFAAVCPNRNKAQVMAVYASLMAKYREAHRSYHTIDHLKFGIGCALKLDIKLLPEEVLAWFYHDAEYQPDRDDNEERSAHVFLRDREQLGFPALDMDTVSERVEAIIRSTDLSQTPMCVVNDMDLAVLGAEPEVYDEYVRKVRKEYHFVSEDVWRGGRSKVLLSFLDRDRLYLTDKFAAHFTAQAYANIRREFERLGAPNASV